GRMNCGSDIAILPTASQSRIRLYCSEARVNSRTCRADTAKATTTHSSRYSGDSMDPSKVRDPLPNIPNSPTDFARCESWTRNSSAIGNTVGWTYSGLTACSTSREYEGAGN